MDEKEQQNIAEEKQQKFTSSQLPSNKKWFSLVGISVIVAVLIVGISSYFYINRQVIDPQDIRSYIKDRHKTCVTDQDCIVATSGCGCGCPDYVVNRDSRNKYESLYNSVCENRGVACGMPCLPMKPVCENNICVTK